MLKSIFTFFILVLVLVSIYIRNCTDWKRFFYFRSNNTACIFWPFCLYFSIARWETYLAEDLTLHALHCPTGGSQEYFRNHAIKEHVFTNNFFGLFSSVTCKEAACSTVLRLKEPKFLQMYALDGWNNK